MKKLFYSFIILSSCIYLQACKQDNSNIEIVAKNFGGEYTLVNQDNIEVTDKDFENKYRLIYFGFTFCPAICPTELQRISTILNKLPEDIANKITPIFITIDPQRDTVQAMKSYVDLFHPRMVGLTGTQAQIDVVKDGYKIYAAKVKDDTMTEYTMDHSSFIYFMGPENTLYKIFKMDDSTDYMIEQIQNYIQ